MVRKPLQISFIYRRHKIWRDQNFYSVCIHSLSFWVRRCTVTLNGEDLRKATTVCRHEAHPHTMPHLSQSLHRTFGLTMELRQFNYQYDSQGLWLALCLPGLSSVGNTELPLCNSHTHTTQLVCMKCNLHIKWKAMWQNLKWGVWNYSVLPIFRSVTYEAFHDTETDAV
jgi:hypothetical protein